MFKKIVLPLAMLAAALAAVVLSYRAGHPFQAHLFHSDALYLPTLFADLFASGRLSDWYLTPAPYFFPDFPLYLSAHLIGQGPYQQILAFALLQVLLTLGALNFVIKEIVGTYRLAVACQIAVVLLWLAVNAEEPYVELFTSASHFGAFLASLVFLALWLLSERNGPGVPRRRALAGMCVLAFLTSLSDNIFLVQTMVPFVVGAVLLRRPGTAGGPGWHALATPGAVLLAGVLGSMSYKLVVSHRTRYPSKLGLSQFDTNLHELLEIFSRLFTVFPLLGLVVCSYVLFGIACVLGGVRRHAFLNLPRPLIILLTFSILSMGATLAAILLTKDLQVAPRYLVPVLMWPVIVSAVLLLHWFGPRFFWPATGAAAVLAGLLLASALRLPQQADPGYYPDQLACIDKALAGKGLRKGVAQYWDAKHFQMFSREPIILAQYFSDLTPQKWITSSRFYTTTYDFAIIAEDGNAQYKLPADRMAELSGAAAEEVVCGNRTLLIFGPDKLRLQKMAAPGSTLFWKGCELPTQVGKATPECASEKIEPALEGFVTFGPYESLAAGEYVFDISYSSSKAPGETAGEWDVMLAGADGPTRLLGGRIDGSAGAPRQLSGIFSIAEHPDLPKVEIRTHANQGGTMKVMSVRLTRAR